MMMYVLERNMKQGSAKRWIPYGFCSNRKLLERVKAGQSDKRQWRIRRIAHTALSELLVSAEVLRKAS